MPNTIKKIKVNTTDYDIDASYLGGNSADEYATSTEVSSTYLPKAGGTITGDLTVNGTSNLTTIKGTLDSNLHFSRPSNTSYYSTKTFKTYNNSTIQNIVIPDMVCKYHNSDTYLLAYKNDQQTRLITVFSAGGLNSGNNYIVIKFFNDSSGNAISTKSLIRGSFATIEITYNSSTSKYSVYYYTTSSETIFTAGKDCLIQFAGILTYISTGDLMPSS